ncbi:MAG TPA: hypothetical protein VHM30_05440 [Gemmatimonadaceae bacterium]|nr:hypothetical protein [Gemmatimonadaceae bacterium]
MTLSLRTIATGALAATTALAACSSDNGTNPPPGIATGAADITQDITANRTFHAETTYTLKGFIHVTNGATLTIEPGTKILGDYATLGASLWIMRGAKIQAVGTADKPIVFTSSQPVGQRKPGDWGGLLIIGNAIDNRTGTVQIEGSGTAATGGSGQNYPVTYSGGTNAADNSGELRYVRVEFGGYAPSQDNELNSFTLAAVGSGTKLSYLEALLGLDDSFEWFGGSVDADHLVSYESGDDHFDQSESFNGRLQYLIAFQSKQFTQRAGAGSPSTDPQGIEQDGCNGTGCTNGFSQQPYTIPLISNFTIVGTGSTATSNANGGIGIMLRRGTGGYYVNGIIARWPRAAISLRDTATYNRAGATGTQNLATADLAVKNVLIVESPTVFQGANGTNVQNSLDLAGNAITQNTTATTASLFTAFPATVDVNTTAAAFDWTPAASSAAASGGLATFTGKLATKGGTAFTGTSYVGAAAPGGTKWWSGWTVYAQQ